MATATIPIIRVFLSSPGDVNDERKIAISYIEWLANFKLFKNRVHIQIIAWDDPRYSTVMRASLTPQEAINRGLARPSECDIVLVLFWSRMGTSFIHTDGIEYQSGTHWELLDALNSSAETVIYRRTEKKLFEEDDDKGRAQYRRVKDFFAGDLFYQDGKIVRSVHEYATPNDFKALFEQNFVELVEGILNNRTKTNDIIQRTENNPPPADTPIIKAVEWDKSRSPFPGLRAFLPSDEDIFFGRTRETDELVKLAEKSRFVAVTGASGSGKSSLVGAGLIPRLRANAILDPNTNISSQNWRYAIMKPAGDKELPSNPFASLYEALIETAFPDMRPNSAEKRRIRRNFLDEIPESVWDVITDGLGKYPHSELLLFIDQFEELFTTTDAPLRDQFMTFLLRAHQSENVRVVITMRNDFFPRCADFPDLTRLINTGNYLVSIPNREALREMIERPAERAGVLFADGLVSQILNDTLQGGADMKGALALMAYALDELYKIASGRADNQNHITSDDYTAIGGVGGAIGNRAQAAFDQLMTGEDETAKERILQGVFHQLVVVDEEGKPTRKRWTLIPEKLPDDQRELIRIFVDARLLVADALDQQHVTLEVAHEALFRNWTTLVNWIDKRKADLYTRDQILRDAKQWQAHGKPEKSFRYDPERIKLVQDALARLEWSLNDLTRLEREFLEPEQARLLRELENINTPHYIRVKIGERLAEIGDTRKGVLVRPDGIPDMAWCHVEKGGQITIETKSTRFGGGRDGETHTFTIKPFYVAKYLTTHAQYQAFIDSEDGYNNPEWWMLFPENYRPQKLASATNSNPNAPRDSISWYQSMAFAHWMDAKYRGNGLFEAELGLNPEEWKISLPPEWVWQWMAQNGDEAREYPWGAWDKHPRANTSEAGINEKSTSVGMYPHGVANCGALDVAGNLLEWCLNDYGTISEMNGYSNKGIKVLLGGSFNYNPDNARAVYRYDIDPNYDSYHYGVRLFAVSIVSNL